MTWTRACATADVAADGDAFRLEADPPIAIFNSEGQLFAIADTCSHGAFSLSEGYVEKQTVECPVHLSTFCLRTGRALKLPATKPVTTYDVRVDGSEVFVDLPR